MNKKQAMIEIAQIIEANGGEPRNVDQLIRSAQNGDDKQLSDATIKRMGIAFDSIPKGTNQREDAQNQADELLRLIFS